MEKPRQSGAKATRAYAYIKHRIIDGTYLPGHRLLLEQISQEAQMSQIPVREALRRLEAEGYVTYKHNAGARVAQLDPAAYASTQHVVAVLEGAATAAAAPHLSPELLAQASELNDEMQRCREQFDADGFMDLNSRFHDLLCSACPNEHLLEILNSERNRMALIRRPTLGIVMRHSQEFVEDHRRLLDLIATNPLSPDIQILAQEHKQRILRAVKEEATTEASTPQPAATARPAALHA